MKQGLDAKKKVIKKNFRQRKLKAMKDHSPWLKSHAEGGNKMDIMSIFQTNWLDFLTWTLAGCMVLALIVHLVARWRPTGFMRKTKDILNWPESLRQAS